MFLPPPPLLPFFSPSSRAKNAGSLLSPKRLCHHIVASHLPPSLSLCRNVQLISPPAGFEIPPFPPRMEGCGPSPFVPGAVSLGIPAFLFGSQEMETPFRGGERKAPPPLPGGHVRAAPLLMFRSRWLPGLFPFWLHTGTALSPFPFPNLLDIPVGGEKLPLFSSPSTPRKENIPFRPSKAFLPPLLLVRNRRVTDPHPPSSRLTGKAFRAPFFLLFMIAVTSERPSPSFFHVSKRRTRTTLFLFLWSAIRESSTRFPLCGEVVDTTFSPFSFRHRKGVAFFLFSIHAVGPQLSFLFFSPTDRVPTARESILLPSPPNSDEVEVRALALFFLPTQQVTSPVVTRFGVFLPPFTLEDREKKKGVRYLF